ncbi:MAG TPA: hypothetical protein VME67_03695 [Mycobacterium sp.]|nr:hypothetical protein [Mycobacterium sp.]HTX94006.1 hypothetical protein [Mycobacterium sp.]
MSRGLGAVQRDILQRLDVPDVEEWITLAELAGYGADKSRIESHRRAVNKLRDAGLVDTRYLRSGRVSILAARLALHPDYDEPRRRVRDVAREDAQIERLRAARAAAEATRADPLGAMIAKAKRHYESTALGLSVGTHVPR